MHKRFGILALVLLTVWAACVSCGDETEDEVGGGSCEDAYDLILKGEVEDFKGIDDVDFKIKLDVLEDDAATGDIKFDDQWYDIVNAVATNNGVAVLFADPAATELLSACTDPVAAVSIYYALELGSDNGFAGPFDGDLRAYCGLDSDEVVGDYDAEGDVTCEDL